jgi:putative glutamine amidotransferase
MSKPLVGICPSLKSAGVWGDAHYLYSRYVTLVAQGGALPVILPVVATRSEAREIVQRIDGLLLTGGPDIDPARYGQTARFPDRLAIPARTASDLLFVHEAKDRGLPVLGICLGTQTLNVAFGGSLLQHIPEDVPGAMEHEDEPEGTAPEHPIRIEPGTVLRHAIGLESATVNSFHHQGIGELAPGFRIAARSPDGVVEAIERTDHPFFLGVHWHPERMLESEVTRRLLRAFVDAARGAWTPAT